MKSYIFIQYKRFCRISSEKGLHPFLSIALMLAAFIGLSELLFLRIDYPQYLYALLGFLSVGYISNHRRTEFLKQLFKSETFYKIRLIENVAIATPFISFLTYKQAFITAAVLLIVSILISFISFRKQVHLIIPSPFSRFPFEFTRGFRRFFPTYLIGYFITYTAIKVDNFNLSIVTLLAVFLVNAIFYSKAEPMHYIWIHRHAPKQFLKHKLKIISLYSVIPASPIVLSLFIFFPDKYWLILIATVSGTLYIMLFMLTKYANYPHEISVTDSLIVTASILFPPLILITGPIYYHRAIQSLNNILHD